MVRIPTIKEAGNSRLAPVNSAARNQSQNIEDNTARKAAETALDYTDAVARAQKDIASRAAKRAQDEYLRQTAERLGREAILPKAPNLIRSLAPKLIAGPAGQIANLLEPVETNGNPDAEAKIPDRQDSPKIPPAGNPNCYYETTFEVTFYVDDPPNSGILNEENPFRTATVDLSAAVIFGSGSVISLGPPLAYGVAQGFAHKGLHKGRMIDVGPAFRGFYVVYKTFDNGVKVVRSGLASTGLVIKSLSSNGSNLVGCPIFPPLTGEPLKPGFELPSPDPNNNGDDCCMCDCSALEAKLARIERVLQVQDFPVTTPQSLLNHPGNEKDVSHTGYADLLGWNIKQQDAILGEFPIEVEIEDTDPTKAGNQSKTVQIANMAEGIADLYGMAFSQHVMKDVHFQMLIRIATEVVGAKNAALIAQEYSRANADYLGYKRNEVKRNIKYSFDFSAKANIETLLKNSEANITGIKCDQEETVDDYLKRCAFAAGITKAVHFKPLGMAGKLLDELKPFLEGGTGYDSAAWTKFVQDLNNETGLLNAGQTAKVKIRDVPKANP